MLCSNCGKCCEETEMELSRREVKRLEKRGFRRSEFTVKGRDGITRLGNIGRWCYFYDHIDNRCRVYEDRPLGCNLYPVMYSVNEGVVIDDLCPMGETISDEELRTKGTILIKLLKTIDRNNVDF